MTEREYRRLMAEAEAEYKAKIAALKLVFRMSNGPARRRKIAAEEASEAADPNQRSLILSEAEHVEPSDKPVRNNGRVYGHLKAQIRAVVAGLSREFDSTEVEAGVRKIDPAVVASSITGALRRMVGGELELVRKGRGRRPSRFRKAEGTNGK